MISEIEEKYYPTVAGHRVKFENLWKYDRVICPQCEYAVVEDEFFPCPACGENICLYCWINGCLNCEEIEEACWKEIKRS